jgi:hypothetical protein
MALLRLAKDALLKLDDDGKLNGRPREKARLLPEIEVELAACQAVAASPGNLNALRSRPPREACRLLRICAGVLSAEGRWDEFVAMADSICGLDASEAEDLYELGRSIAWCVDHLDHGTWTASASRDVKSLRLRYVDRAVAVLVRAIEHGLQNTRRLDDDFVLAPLRQHADYRKLSERIAAPNAAPGRAAGRANGKAS